MDHDNSPGLLASLRIMLDAVKAIVSMWKLAGSTIRRLRFNIHPPFSDVMDSFREEVEIVEIVERHEELDWVDWGCKFPLLPH
jgi:hypothetical protein